MKKGLRKGSQDKRARAYEDSQEKIRTMSKHEEGYFRHKDVSPCMCIMLHARMSTHLSPSADSRLWLHKRQKVKNFAHIHPQPRTFKREREAQHQ